ncbi:stress-induced-phosphoprotein [Anaeramoeba flamelloides]|uniref:Stress-induced-phosphoprotein n=1 Tax=Anaeramoeba flamelloides TaxID=1746091 RepID=A0ABQ8YX79_9EUKA|nr:stress-induced-phosphoprotein [Anaeramoeba flamelloides]
MSFRNLTESEEVLTLANNSLSSQPYSDTMRILIHGLHLDPDNVEIQELRKKLKQARNHQNKGNDYYKAKKYQDAIEQYNSAQVLIPNTLILSNKAACLLNLKKYEQASKVAQSAIDLAPNLPKGYLRLSSAFKFLNQKEKAIETLKLALKKCEDKTLLHSSLEKLTGGKYQPGQSYEITEKETLTKLINQGKTLVVRVHAQWCGPCKQIAPFYNKLAKETTGMIFLEIDIDKVKLPVQGVPHFAFYKGGKMISEFSGANQEALVEGINSLK